MADQHHVQLLRGRTASNDAFTGKIGEVTVNTDTGALRVHDGVTPGGRGTVDAVYVDEGQVPASVPKDWDVGTIIIEGPGAIKPEPGETPMTYPELSEEHKVGTLNGVDVFSRTFVCTAGTETNKYNTIQVFNGNDITCIKGAEGCIINSHTGEEEALFDMHWNIDTGDDNDLSYSVTPCVVRKFTGGLFEYHSDPMWNGQRIYVTITYIKN